MWMVYAINVNKRYMVDWKDYYGVRCGMMMLEDILLYDCCCCCYYMHNVNVSNEQTNKQNNNGNSNKEPKDWKNHCRQHWRPIQFFKRHRSHFEVSFVLDKQQFHNGHKHSFFTEGKSGHWNLSLPPIPTSYRVLLLLMPFSIGYAQDLVFWQKDEKEAKLKENAHNTINRLSQKNLKCKRKRKWTRACARTNEFTLIYAKQQMYIYYASTLFNLFRAISWFLWQQNWWRRLKPFSFSHLRLDLFPSPDDFLVFRFLWNSLVHAFKISILIVGFVFKSVSLRVFLSLLADACDPIASCRNFNWNEKIQISWIISCRICGTSVRI